MTNLYPIECFIPLNLGYDSVTCPSDSLSPPRQRPPFALLPYHFRISFPVTGQATLPSTPCRPLKGGRVLIQHCPSIPQYPFNPVIMRGVTTITALAFTGISFANITHHAPFFLDRMRSKNSDVLGVSAGRLFWEVVQPCVEYLPYG